MAYTLLVVGVILYGLRGGTPDRRVYVAIAAAAAVATLWMMR